MTYVDTCIEVMARKITAACYSKRGQQKTLILLIIILIAIIVSIVLIMKFKKSLDSGAGSIFDRL